MWPEQGHLFFVLFLFFGPFYWWHSTVPKSMQYWPETSAAFATLMGYFLSWQKRLELNCCWHPSLPCSPKVRHLFLAKNIFSPKKLLRLWGSGTGAAPELGWHKAGCYCSQCRQWRHSFIRSFLFPFLFFTLYICTCLCFGFHPVFFTGSISLFSMYVSRTFFIYSYRVHFIFLVFLRQLPQ